MNDEIDIQNQVSGESTESNNHIINIVREKNKRGSKSASVEATTTASKPELKTMIGNVLYWYKREIVHTDEECAERLNEFFHHVGETGEIPTVEKMCLALGTVRQVVWEWENGSKGHARADMIKKAKEILAALDAELVSNNKLPVVSYIFRAKNFYALSDKTEITLTPNTPLQNMDAKDAQKKIIDAIPADTSETE